MKVMDLMVMRRSGYGGGRILMTSASECGNVLRRVVGVILGVFVVVRECVGGEC